MDRPFEDVYTVTEYHDGPRGGVADFDGAPHVYRSISLDADERAQDEDRFELSPAAPDVLELALEDRAIWLRWREAFDAGRTTVETHPALPADARRHADIAAVLRRALAIDPARRRVARGEFRERAPARTDLPPDVARPLEVRWTPVE